MELNKKDERAMKKYLLGELAQPKQLQLEERLMTDNETFDRLLLLEDELVDAYVCEALSAHERERFESHFLSTPERRQKVRFASALRRYVSQADVPDLSAPTLHAQRPASLWQSLVAYLCSQRPVLEWSLAASLLLIVTGGSWSAVKISRLQNQIEQMRAQQAAPQGHILELQQQAAGLRQANNQLTDKLRLEQGQRAALEQKLAAVQMQEGSSGSPIAKTGPSLLAAVSLALAPGAVRDMGGPKIPVVPSGTKLVRLELYLPADDYDKYQAVLLDANGGEISSQTLPKPKTPANDHVLLLPLLADNLSPGYYSVKLSGFNASGALEGVGTYTFRATNK